MSAPAASVLMSAFDAERYIQRALQSVLDQTVRDLEVVVVDDGSNDGTRTIIESMARRDPRIRPLYLDSNMGLAAALNRGLRMCRSAVVFRMDADDVALPRRIEVQLAFLETNADIGLVGSQAVVIDDAGHRRGRVHRPLSPPAVLWHSLLDNPFIHPTVAVRRSLLTQVGAYDPGLGSAQDYELWHRVLQVTRGANLAEPLLLYRQTGEGITRARRDEQLAHHRAVSDDRIAVVVRAVFPPRELELLRSVFVYPEMAEVEDEKEVFRAIDVYRRLGETFCLAIACDRAARRVIRQQIARRVAGTLRSRSALPLLPVARALPRYPTFLWDLAWEIHARRKPAQ
jgi:glycosyltransferase involved in cell wall biosynthesis